MKKILTISAKSLGIAVALAGCFFVTQSVSDHMNKSFESAQEDWAAPCKDIGGVYEGSLLRGFTCTLPNGYVVDPEKYAESLSEVK